MKIVSYACLLTVLLLSIIVKAQQLVGSGGLDFSL